MIVMIALAVLLIICIAIIIIAFNKLWEATAITFCVICVLGVSFFIACICLIINAHVHQDIDRAIIESERAALVYQVENGLYLGDALGEFNAKVIQNKMYSQSPWTNWFYGDFWDEIEPIEVGNGMEAGT